MRDALRLHAETALRLLRFFSRIPVPAQSFESEPHGLPDARLAGTAMPFAAILIALPAALVLLIGGYMDVPYIALGFLCVAVLAMASGALHEDGIADCADALGGGQSIERRLEIMRDSRIGAHGALALMLVTGLRVVLIAEIIRTAGIWPGFVTLLLVAMISRVLCLAPLTILDPARSEGRGASFGRPDLAAIWLGLFGILVLGVVALIPGRLTPVSVPLAIVFALLALLFVLWLAKRLIGGQTGDVCGAVQQLAEVAALLAFAIAAA
jgi:adenosylcobinamide-GDP ribazoletransferase